ncbi:MAG: GIY-YIG nuclease family protein [Bacteroidetes bacterium]|nr:GIY-YIG nuclease family protein [Bacteroidota bacterium]
MFYVYILVSQKDGSLYTGQTNDLKKRLKKHNAGNSKSTKSKTPYDLGYFEIIQTRAEAMWREWELKKQFSTEYKKKLIAEFDPVKINKVLS